MPRIKFVPQTCDFLGFASDDPEQCLAMVKRAGEVCYKNESSKSPLDFTKMLIKRGHLSVLEHSAITVQARVDDFYRYPPNRAFFRLCNGDLVTGSLRCWLEASSCFTLATFNALHRHLPEIFTTYNLPFWVDLSKQPVDNLIRSTPYVNRLLIFRIVTDRGISHELVRHRSLQFSQESTRWINYDKRGGFTFIYVQNDYPETLDIPIDAISRYATGCVRGYCTAISAGVPPQIARDLLPHFLKTELIVSGYPDAWLDFVSKRNTPAAHPRIRAIAQAVQQVLIANGYYPEDKDYA